MGLPPVLAQRLSLPVVASPLFLCSGPELVKAECQAGVIGSFPALNARPSSLLGDWLDEIEESNAAYALANPDAIVAPFAVNQIVHRSNDRLEHDMAVIVEHKVPIVITSLGARPEINDAVHSYGGIVLHDIINNEFAHKAIDKGADGIIAVAAGAGGHAGTLSPFALVSEIREWFDGPLALSGSIANGRSIRNALDRARLTLDDLDLVETHDCFTVAELIEYEAMGLAAPGEGYKVVREGIAEKTGRLPVNPSGGLISKGHPLGATGAIRAATVVHALRRHKLKYGMVTMCVGTGQGAAGIIEAL